MKRLVTYLLDFGWRKPGFWAPILVGLCFGGPMFWWGLAMDDVDMSPVEMGLRLWFSVTVLGWLWVGGSLAIEKLDTLNRLEEEARERRRRE